MISLCTWHKNWPPLRETLPANLALIAGQDVEWCITDFGSSDGSWSWLQDQAADHPQLKVFRSRRRRIHFARCYNEAFRHAAGDILVCLDADNILGPRFLEVVQEKLTADSRRFLHVWSGDWLDGTCGRMAMHRDVFAELGGYDEAFGPCGYQDLDLRDRAKALGCEIVTITEADAVGSAIRTELAEKSQHLGTLNYQICNTQNAAKSRANIAAKKLKANQ
jgi:GT2 family glycosyltransferase